VAIGKAYRQGTQRLVAPDVTLARVRPMLRAMGITRIANVTGLDTIGIPVVMVCRPNSRSVAVSQGKGLDLAAAKASGVMEAIELHHAETIALPLRLGTRRDLATTLDLVDVGRLPKSRNGRYRDDTPILWIEGIDLVGDRMLWLPYECVHADYTLPQPTGSGCFQANTNGLASGNQALEAISHGICEVIERDATTLWYLRSREERSRRRLDLASVSDPACRGILDLYETANIDVAAWDMTTDVGVAAIRCLAMGRENSAAHPEFGAGCHPVREIALLRALTEAAQVRTTYIAGSRDDLVAGDYAIEAVARRVAECRAYLSDAATRPLSDVPSFAADTFDEDIEWLLQRLIAVGIEQVAAVELTKAEFGIPVVRIVIPGLEGPDKGERGDHMPGARARAMERPRP
jgi:YcaO-like protein with predicted kinase domain